MAAEKVHIHSHGVDFSLRHEVERHPHGQYHQPHHLHHQRVGGSAFSSAAAASASHTHAADVRRPSAYERSTGTLRGGESELKCGSTKIEWAKINSQHSTMPQFAATSNTTAKFAKKHVKAARWGRLRSSNEPDELDWRFKDDSEHIEPYVGLSSSAFLAAASAAHATTEGHEHEDATAPTPQPSHGSRHARSNSASVPLSAFLDGDRDARSVSTTDLLLHGSDGDTKGLTKKEQRLQRQRQQAINDDRALVPTKTTYNADSEYWNQHGTARKKSGGARVRDALTTMKLYPQRTLIQQQCLRRVIAAIKENPKGTLQQLNSHDGIRYLLELLVNLREGDNLEDVQLLALELLNWAISMSPTPDLFTLFYTDSLTNSSKTCLGCLVMFLKMAKPSDPVILALVAAIVHAWLAHVPAALSDPGDGAWGGTLVPSDVGPEAVNAAKTAVLRRLRHDASALRRQLVRCSRR
eukprot:INCI10288.1.p1 GENE.INCI10288.1~~INCI10288.1.p1  ORF type:complete len:467 (-),score=74.56 INCI10288.1:245-1645(-)